VFGVADEDTDDPTPTPSPIDIQGDEDWINVTRLGNLYTINHKPPPGAAHAMASMKGLSTDFSCDSVSWSTVADVQSWVNNELLANIREIFYDTRGHIYDLKDCAGASVTPTDDPTSVYLQSSMVADYFSGSDIGPDAVGAGGGIDFTYKILNDGANYLAYIGTKKVQVGLIMDNGNPVQIATSGDVPVLFSMTKLAENVAGTSGLARVNPTELILGTERFQFNSTANLHVSIIGVGLIQSAAFNTSSCSATNNISGITNIRDYQDPNAAAMSLSVSYDVTFLGSATSPGFITATDNGPYISAVTISYADDTPVAWSTEGSGGPFKTETRFLELDNTSETGTFDKISLRLRDAAAAGDQIKICSKLLTFDRLTDANASSCDYISISSDDDCITDQDGVRVTDESGDCITGDSYLLRSDQFTESSLNTTRWDTSTITATVSYAGVVNFSGAVNERWDISQTSGISIAGEFNAEFNLNSIDLDISEGVQIHLRVTIGGTLVQLALVESTAGGGTTRGIYKTVGAVDTLLSASPAGTYGATSFQITRNASDSLSFIYNGSTINNITQAGTVTALQVVISNANVGAAGTITAVADDFIIESPIGTPYYT